MNMGYHGIELEIKEVIAGISAIDGIDTEPAIRMCGSESEYLALLNCACRDFDKTLPNLRELDTQLMGIKVHAIKSTLASIGANALSALAKSIEMAVYAQDLSHINKSLPGLIADVSELNKRLKKLLSFLLDTDSQKTPDTAILSENEVLLRIRDLALACRHANADEADKICREISKSKLPGKLAAYVKAAVESCLDYDYDEAIKYCDEIFVL